jgi:flagellar basal body rod protein FlgC
MKVLEVSRVGMQLAERQLERAASNIARAAQADADVDLAKDMVSLGSAKTANAANVAVARTASETLGTLVDIIT